MITEKDLCDSGYKKYPSPFVSHIALFQKKYKRMFTDEPLYHISVFEYTSGFEAEVWFQMNTSSKEMFKVTLQINSDTTVLGIEDLFLNIFTAFNMQPIINND